MDREGGTGLQVDDVPCTTSEWGGGGGGSVKYGAAAGKVCGAVSSQRRDAAVCLQMSVD